MEELVGTEINAEELVGSENTAVYAAPEDIIPDLIEEVIGDLTVRYKPIERVTTLDKDNNPQTKFIEPHFVRHIRSENYQAALTSIEREIAIHMVIEGGLVATGVEAPIAVSAAVPQGCFVIVNERIVLNETEALLRAIDSDGDRATLLTNETGEMAVLSKFPITKLPPILTRLDSIGAERFYDFDESDWASRLAKNPIPEYNQEEAFIKAHREIPVGPLTSKHNIKALYEAIKIKKLPYEYIGEFLMSDPQRFIDIEEGGIKTSTKGKIHYERPAILDYPRVLQPQYSPFLTSTGRLGSMSGDQLDFLLDTDLIKLATDVRDLKLEFRDIKKSNREEPADIEPRMIDGTLIKRLIDLGILNYREYQSADPKLPNSALVWLQRPSGPPVEVGKDVNGDPIYKRAGVMVALTDVKRESGLNAGLTYALLLPPVFDAEQSKFVHPINHMAKVLANFDSRIMNPRTRQITGYYPRNAGDLAKYEVKTAMLQKVISEYCSEYGDPCPAEWVNGVLTPTDIAVSITTKTAVIDYMKPSNEHEMFAIAKRACKIRPLNIEGNKSNNRRVRKYPLAKPEGGPLWAPANTNPQRSGRQRAQLLRTCVMEKFQIAILSMDTKTQILITPSGIAKQNTERVFLPEISNIEHPDYPDIHDYITLTGEKRRCWTKSPRRIIRIGKLVDLAGNKFMPRRFKQVYDQYGDPIDLIFPIEELENKDAQYSFIKNGEWQEISITSDEIEKGETKFTKTHRVIAYVVTKTMFRTGAASENVPARPKRVLYRNIDKEPIKAQLRKIRDVPVTTPVLQYPLMLQELGREIQKRIKPRGYHHEI